VKRRRAVIVGVLSLAIMLVHLVLVRLMAHGHVAHVLLGSGNAAPPLGAALLAVSLVLTRLFAIVIGPGVLLASFVSLAAHALAGPRYRDGDGDGGAGGDGAADGSTGITSGAGTHSDEEGSGAAAVLAGTG